MFLKFSTVFELWGNVSGILAQKLQKVCQNCNLCVQKNFVEILIFEKTFTIFSSTDQKYPGLLSKILSRRKLLNRVFSSEKISCLPTEVEGEGIWCSVRTFSRFVKTALYVSEWDFWLNCFFYDFFEFRQFFLTVGRTFGNIGAKTLEKLSKVPSTWTTKLLEESVFFEENFYFYNFFEFWCKTLQTSVWKLSARFGKLLSTLVHGIFLHNIIIFLEKLYAYKRTSRENVRNFVKLFWHGGQICFLCVQRTSLKKSFSFSQNLQNFQLFLRLWEKHFGFLAIIILLGCRNFFQMSRGYFWKNLILKTNSLNFFFFFGLRAQFFWTFGENFAIGLSKLLSMCPVEIFDWTVFSTNIFEIFHRLRAMRNCFWHFGAKTSKSLSELQSLCPKKFLWNFWFLKKLLQFFRVLIRNFPDFCQKFWVGENCGIGFFSSEKNSCLPTEVEGEGNWCSVRTFSRFVKTALYVSEWDFWLNCFFYVFFEFRHFFLTMGRTVANNGAKTLEKLSEVPSTWTTKLLEESVFFEENIYFYNIFEFWCKTLQTSVGKLSAGLKNCFQHSFRGASCITLSFSSRNFTPTNGLWRKCLKFCKNFLTWWSKLFSLCAEDIFEEMVFFFTKSSNFSVVFRLWGKLFEFLATIFLLGCQNCFQVSRGYFWKNLILKTNSLSFFFFFGLRAQFFWTFGENFAIGLSKLLSMCPVEISDWTVFSTNLIEIFHRLRAMRNCFWHFGAKTSKSLSELQSMCTKSFCGNFDFWKNFYNFFEYWSKISRTFVKNFE